MKLTHVHESTADDTSSHWVKHCQTELWAVQALYIGSHVNKMAWVHIQKNIFPKFQIYHDISRSKETPKSFYYNLLLSECFINFSFCACILNYFYRSQVISPQDIALPPESTQSRPCIQHRRPNRPRPTRVSHTWHDIDKAFVSFYSLVWRFVLNVYADDHFN